MASGPKGNKKARSIWLELEETELIKFLTKKKAEAGDGMNFKMATYKEAADMIAKYRAKGLAKDGAAVKRKWTAVCANMAFIQYMSNFRVLGCYSFETHTGSFRQSLLSQGSTGMIHIEPTLIKKLLQAGRNMFRCVIITY